MISISIYGSLGVVFVSATDSTDVFEGQRSGDLAAAAKMFGLTSPETEVEVHLNDSDEFEVQDDMDFDLAMSLYKQDKEAQLKSDRELAEQLQMRENVYRTPQYVSNNVYHCKGITSSLYHFVL